jgi:hypothetical protein
MPSNIQTPRVQSNSADSMEDLPITISNSVEHAGIDLTTPTSPRPQISLPNRYSPSLSPSLSPSYAISTAQASIDTRNNNDNVNEQLVITRRLSRRVIKETEKVRNNGDKPLTRDKRKAKKRKINETKAGRE